MTGDHGPLHTAPTNIRHPFYGRPPRIEQQRGETSDQWRSRAHAHVVAALMDAIGPDVELGDYDRSIITWLAGWDVGTVGTVASLFRRLRAAGETGRGATAEPRPVAHLVACGRPDCQCAVIADFPDEAAEEAQ